MKQTKHIDFTGGHFISVSPVLFPESNLVVSFASRDAAEAAIKETFGDGRSAIRLYNASDKHGTGEKNGS